MSFAVRESLTLDGLIYAKAVAGESKATLPVQSLSGASVSLSVPAPYYIMAYTASLLSRSSSYVSGWQQVPRGEGVWQLMVFQTLV